MKVSGWGMSLEGDLEDETFLLVSMIFPHGPVALANATRNRANGSANCVREGDVLLAVDTTALRGLSERDMKKLIADSRSLARLTLHFGHQASLASGRSIEPFSIEVILSSASAGVEEWEAEEGAEVLDLGKKASKQSARAKKAAKSTMKTRLRPEQQVGLSKYSQMVASMPPVWVPPPPEYTVESQSASAGAAARSKPHILSEASKVWGCGNNSEGELGLGHRRFVLGVKAVQLPRVSGAHGRRNTSTPHAAATGEGFSIICTGTETAVCGTDVHGRLGLAARGSVVYFTRISALSGVAVQSVACGYEHSVLLTKEQTPRTFAWGGNEAGQLGLGSAGGSRDVPTEIESLKGVAFSLAAAGRAHTLLLEAGGAAVWSFGAHESGQLGRIVHAIPTDELSTVAATPLPLPLPFATSTSRPGHSETGCKSACDPPADADSVTQVAAGAHHSLLVTERGAVYCCGLNADGQCGIGSWQAKVEQFARVALAPHLVAYLGACGALHSVVVARHAEEYGCESERARESARERERGSLVLSCGSGGCWQLGAGSSQVDRRVAELVCGLPEGLRVTSVTCGMFHTLCVAEEEEDGHKSIWAWGADLFGDLRKLQAQPQASEEAAKNTECVHACPHARRLRGSDTAARGIAGRVDLDSCVQLQGGIALQRIVSGSSSSHALLLLAWKLPWHLERVLWIGVLKGGQDCLLSRLALDGPRTSSVLLKIIDLVSAP